MALDTELSITEQGFLLDKQQWTEVIAQQLAEKEELELTPAHWEILYFIQDFYQEYAYLPNARVFSKALKKSLGEEKGNSRYLQGLFPKGPLKYACKIAGLPKPPSCL